MICIEIRRPPLVVGEVESELKEINKPYQLGVHLRVPSEHLERFEEEHRDDITRQRVELEVITYWLRNFADASWNTLAAAVERIGGHNLLVAKLRDLAQRFSQKNDPGMQEKM